MKGGPGHLPRSESDLQAWRVWVDALLEQGDPLGELLSLELSLPALATRTQLAGFRIRAQRRCRAPVQLRVAWCLGHARVVRVMPRKQPAPGRRGWPYLATRSDLDVLADFLERPEAGLLERVEVCLSPSGLARFGRALRGAPQTCTALGLECGALWSARDFAALIDALPDGIRRIELLGANVDPMPFATRRFDELDLRVHDCSPAQLGRLAAMERRPALVLGRVADVRAAAGLARCRVGREGDAALVEPATGALITIARAPLLALQERHGVITIRAQLHRTVPEAYSIGGMQLLTGPAWGSGAVWLRDSDGRWSVRSRSERQVSKEPVKAALATGTQVNIGDRQLVFLEDVAEWGRFVVTPKSS